LGCDLVPSILSFVEMLQAVGIFLSIEVNRHVTSAHTLALLVY